MANRSRRARRSGVTPTQKTASPVRQRAWLHLALLAVAGALAYANSLWGPFVADDNLSIVTNRSILHVWPLSTVLFPERELPVAGRPLINLSFAINYAIGGLDVRGYHLWNIAIHLLCALLLFGLVRRTLSSSGLISAERSVNLAFASALIWVLHPLQTEAVDYLTQRTELMMGLFYLLTLYASVRANRARQASMWRIVSVLSCAAGMACKESMVTAPLMVVVYDRVFVFPSLKEAFRARWRLYGALVVTWIMLVGLMRSGPRVHSAGFSSGLSPWTYLINQTVMIVQYLRLTVWPRSLVFDYGVPQPLTLGEVMPYAITVTLLLLLTIAALLWRPKLGFFGAWFFVTLAPASSIVPITTEVGAERRMYVPLAALVVLAVVAVALFWEQIKTAWPRARVVSARGASIGGVSLLILVSAALAAGTVRRNREYASALDLARTVLERRPQGRAHHMLAGALLAAGRREEAVAHLREAIRDDPRARYTLGEELFNEGRLEEAIGQLEEFIRLQPILREVITARMTIGRALLRQGRKPEAAEQFTLVLKMVPLYNDAHAGLAEALFAQQKFEDAIVHYREFLRLHPNESPALTNLGIASAATGRIDEAVQAFRRALDTDTQSSSAHRNLANALLGKRQFDEAARHAQQAVTLQPRDSVAHDILGLALGGRGQVDEAIGQFQQSLQADPGNAEAREHLTIALRIKDSIRRPQRPSRLK